eukprot:3938629-Rhodomonas_salina.3
MLPASRVFGCGLNKIPMLVSTKKATKALSIQQSNVGLICLSLPSRIQFTPCIFFLSETKVLVSSAGEEVGSRLTGLLTLAHEYAIGGLVASGITHDFRRFANEGSALIVAISSADNIRLGSLCLRIPVCLL